MGDQQLDQDVALLEMEADLRNRLKIEPLALEEEFIRCPVDIAFLGGKHGRAIGEHLRAKARAKKLRGLILLEKRQELLDKGAKPTESQVEALADQDPRWIAAQDEEISAEVTREVAKTNVAAILAKKDMLVQMGANTRAEMERDPVIRERARGHRGIGG